ncbi:HypC/HybG/HupF family hydrogenase formation chaperone [Rhodopseudomonas pseudopalustris]|uniref:Hydrogenase maturation factor HypC n=1 Tax=Rhodopseudomonas pseudopalustris TaxID=1513892 RepID=A0A1H8NMA0_9BRAD|nr:HypC/HybG/HupF family hydrogenase formation chaperone [Rhodopseudomonas pseudopalustris]MBB1092161.1 HypC/HybG/HupF family hydrogenase formation chaperone [Rhodopseudomonas palustris]SEO30692.1 Hydrogenase maturation protein HypC [Rhodopseudomonas pseudopalustris]
MCLAIPAEVIELLPDQMARVSLDGVIKVVSVALVAPITVGDYVIVHVGFALTRIDPEEAQRTLALLAEMGQIATEVAP